MAKAFAWSFSKLKNYEVCPKRHYEIDIAKSVREAEDPDGPLVWGNKVHAAMAGALGPKRVPLPPDMSPYQVWIDRVLAGPGDLLIEQKYAINKNFEKCEYFGPTVWYRGIADVARIYGPVGLALDWKTGKPKPDSVQLALMAQCLFSFYPQLTHVRAEFVWLQEENCTTPEVYTRQDIADMWYGLLDRVHQMENAHKTMTYPPKPNGLCKSWCPVVSCPHHGKSSR